MLKLDYTLNTPEERLALVNQILEEDPHPNEKYLEILADYLIFCMEKEEKRQKKILTQNRLATVNKRETSFEGLVSKFENGEDGVYNLLNDNKYVIFQPKISITEEDYIKVPELKQTREAIKFWQNVLTHAEGRERYIAKKALIDFRKEQYVIKTDRLQPIVSRFPVMSTYQIKFDCREWVDPDGNAQGAGVTLLNPAVCSAILCNYSRLKESGLDNPDSDTHNLMIEFDDVSGRALANYPLYYRIVECKIDGMSNEQIQKELDKEFGIAHSLEYISSLWRKKIPNLIASQAEDDFYDWYYLVKEKGQWKRCSRCGKVKLAHNKYFSKNSTSKDGFYSICKDCRNTKDTEFKKITFTNKDKKD